MYIYHYLSLYIIVYYYTIYTKDVCSQKSESACKKTAVRVSNYRCPIRSFPASPGGHALQPDGCATCARRRLVPRAAGQVNVPSGKLT